MSRPASVIAVIGGGRWGQVTLSVLAKMNAPFDRIIVISQANAAEVRLKIAEFEATSTVAFELIATLDEALAKYTIQAAIVVNAATEHFQTARRLIKHGIHVLVEKPIAQSQSRMQTLIDEALEHHVCIVPGLNYRFCSYLKNFSNEIATRGAPNRFSLKWVDATNEIRYGQVKKHDTSINVVQDVMPHIWTILSVIFKSQMIRIDRCLGQDVKGSQAVINATVKGIHGEVLLERNGQKRQRYLSVQFDTGSSLILDFSTEPGTIYADEKKFSGDVGWEQSPTPLTRQLEYFFSVISSGSSVDEDLQCCMESVICTERAASLLITNDVVA